MDYFEKTSVELKEICKERKIKGISGKNKLQLVELIQGSETALETTGVAGAEVTRPVEAAEMAKITTIAAVTAITAIATDAYTPELLKVYYDLHKSYVKGIIDATKKAGVKVRLPCIPEHISENIVKQIIHNKLNDATSRWDCKMGDLHSRKEGKQECKCFTSDGPPSFTPSSEWDVIYFLDARNWLSDAFILYRIPLKRTSEEWKNIKVSKTQTFEDQAKQGRRPRITWESLHPQIEAHCTKVYEGTFDDIFILRGDMDCLPPLSTPLQENP